MIFKKTVYFYQPVAGLAVVLPKPVPPNNDGAVEAGAAPNPPNGVAEYNNRFFRPLPMFITSNNKKKMKLYFK